MSVSTSVLAVIIIQLSQFICLAFQQGASSICVTPTTFNRYEYTDISQLRYRTTLPSLSIISPIYRSSSCILHMSDNNEDKSSSEREYGRSDQASNVKFFELEDAFEDDGENVVGTKFFGGNTIKDELYVEEEEEMAIKLQNVSPEKETEYKRFDDNSAFRDELASNVGESLQSAINEILYNEENGSDILWKEDSSLSWDTPFPKSKKASGQSPLKELAASKSFYNKLDVAILSGNTIKSEGTNNIVEIRWDVGALWPNPWESRVLLTGTSTLTVREDKDNNSIVLLKQVDMLDGKNPKDITGSLSPQLPPRFWDMYHIGMTPSAELDRRFDSPLASSSSLSTTANNKGKKGLLASYKVSYLPPRLVTEPSLVDTNGRDGRAAQTLPNHGFTTAIKTMGPKKESFVPVSPVEISISKAEGKEGGSLVKWSVPVPPEFASNIELPLPLMDDIEDVGVAENEDGSSLATITTESKSLTGRPTKPPPNPVESRECSYSLRPSRLVATLPFAGNPQDEEVTQLRRQLYQDVVEKDGYTPKLDPVTKRPIFFFWMNDAKACFTRVGGLGMAVYEWRGFNSKVNEVGIELEL